MEVKKTPTKANTETINQKWFDKECEQLKKRKCQLLNNYRVTHTSEQLDEYLECTKGYKDLCVKKIFYRELMKSKLCEESKDSTVFWKTIKSPKSSQSIVKKKICYFR